MNKRKVTIILLASFIIYAFIYQFFLLKTLLKYVEFINAAFVLLVSFFSIFILGFRKDSYTFLKKNITMMTIIALILFFTISYGAGLMVGFLKNSYALNFTSIMDNMFAPFIIIVCIELFRYTVIWTNRDSKFFLVLITVVLALFEVFTSVRIIDFNNFTSTFKLVTATILPIFIKNMVLSYLTFEVGYRPALIYRLVLELYIFVIPILPNFGDYINSMIGICFPILLYIYTYKVIDEDENGIQYNFNKKVFHWTDIPIIAFIVLFVCLLSGKFSYYMIGVGSGSMMPQINRGDAVIIHKIKDEKQLKVGDIVAYYHDNKTIIHRLVKIERLNGKVYYRTKGDANNSYDNVDIEFDDIKGKVNMRIPYIAYPSVFLT